MVTDVYASSGHPLQRNAGIDALRGLSILLVLLHHIGLRIPLHRTALGDYLPHWLASALNYNGYEAVFVFFGISGFLIAGNSLRRWGQLGHIHAKAFYVRRFARIVPCLLALVIVLSALHLAGVQDYVIHREGQSLPRAVLAALGLHLNWYEGHYGYLPGGWDVLWSLSIEEVFYIGFPLVCLLFRRTAWLAPLLLLLALSLPWTHAAIANNEIWQEKAYLPGMAAIAMGVLGALIAAYQRPPKMPAIHLMLLMGVSGLASILLIEPLLWPWLRDGCLLMLTSSVMLMLIALQWRETFTHTKPARGLGWLRACGRLSYELYLSHMFVVTALVRLFKATGADMRPGYLWYVPGLLACWVLAWLIERYFSLPCERWLRGRWLAKDVPHAPIAPLASAS